MKLKIFIFFSSILLTLTANAQPFRIKAIRIGLDPIKSASMFFKEKDLEKNAFYYNTWEVNGELIGPSRTTFITEIGYTKAHRQELQSTLDYTSQGYYLKSGLNFNFSEFRDKAELIIGWRIGVNDYKETAVVKLKGDYWNNELFVPFQNKKQQTFWGEVLVGFRRSIFPQSPKFNKIWWGATFRLKIRNQFKNLENYSSYNSPGFGGRSFIVPGVSASIFYQIDIKKRKIFK